MGKTYKDTANYHRFKGSVDEAPKHIREKAERMDEHYKGYRSGDDRKSNARSKVIERRIERKRMKRGVLTKHSTTLK